MAQNQGMVAELSVLLIFMGFWMLFVDTNVSPQLGNVYLGFIAIGGLIVLADYIFGKRDIKLVNPSYSWIGASALAFIGALAVLFGGQLVAEWLSGVPISGTLSLLQSTSPVFSNSAIINFVTFTLIVAFVETYTMFMGAVDLLGSVWKVEFGPQALLHWKTWLIIFSISIIFMLLHVTAKGISDQNTLVIVFFMAIVSMVLAVFTKEGRTPIMMHVILNGLAMYPTIAVYLPV